MRRSPGQWALGDFDATGRHGEVIDEFMGFPWSVWIPEV